MTNLLLKLNPSGWLERQYDRLTRSLPFRMAVGKLGIRLAEIGRALQTRYANWNSEFRLKVEFWPPPNDPHVCIIHVSKQVTQEPILTFVSPESQVREQTPLVKELFATPGVKRIRISPYEIQINKANVFEWDEFLPIVEAVILKHLTTA